MLSHTEVIARLLETKLPDKQQQYSQAEIEEANRLMRYLANNFWSSQAVKAVTEAYNQTFGQETSRCG